MKAVSAREMQEIDRSAIQDYGIPPEALMFNAGQRVYEIIEEIYPGIERAAVFSGTGNNGGDGFVTAYLLFNRGIDVALYIAGQKNRLSRESLIYYNLCIKTGITIEELIEEKDLADKIDLSGVELIVDSLTGTGFADAPRGILSSLIGYINNSGIGVLSIDMPSGLPSDGDSPEWEVIRADCTVTVGLLKISLAAYPGRISAGNIKIADIGFPSVLLNSENIKNNVIDENYVRCIIRKGDSWDKHKGDSGHLLIIGGFDGREGAAMLAAMAAFECGAGLLTLVTTEKSRNIIAGRIPELMTFSLKDFGIDETPGGGDDIISGVKKLLSANEFDSLIIGPGMGRGGLSKMILESVIGLMGETSVKNILIDGDGLYHLSEKPDMYRQLSKEKCIITPHFKEASLLMDTDIGTLKKNRLSSAKKLSDAISAVALLKGPGTIISNGIDSYINTTGNPSLATAGSGDVLSGIIGSFMLTKPLMESACIGAYLHGLASDLYCREEGVAHMKATQIVEYLKNAIKHASREYPL